MTPDEIKKLKTKLRVTYELCRTNLSPDAQVEVLRRLSSYPWDAVSKSLEMCQDEVPSWLSLNHITERIKLFLPTDRQPRGISSNELAHKRRRLLKNTKINPAFNSPSLKKIVDGLLEVKNVS